MRRGPFSGSQLFFLFFGHSLSLVPLLRTFALCVRYLLPTLPVGLFLAIRTIETNINPDLVVSVKSRVNVCNSTTSSSQFVLCLLSSLTAAGSDLTLLLVGSGEIATEKED